ncbi:MAG: dTDP-4-dehydrorhamnose 3,5-epimerase [Oscillospiraceae bacterium]|nr:dTDP-4-dehydrorhamnose 3,5-epimerase [Oscillospiraceae bacterium]
MNAIELNVSGVFLIEPTVYGDTRGWFYEVFSQRELQKIGIINPFVQDNRSFSAQCGTLRGLHCQSEPAAQGKLFTCTRGGLLDVAVDVREGSPSYLQWACAELTAENKRQLWIPRGCLHGFVTLAPETEVYYKVDAYYSPEHDRSIRFDDPQFGVKWGIDAPILSQKDLNAPLWRDAGLRFRYGG